MLSKRQRLRHKKTEIEAEKGADKEAATEAKKESQEGFELGATRSGCWDFQGTCAMVNQLK